MGSTSNKGPRGKTGRAGIVGSTGRTGRGGPSGGKGERGATGRGDRGAKGDTGATGKIGETGATGPKGSSGDRIGVAILVVIIVSLIGSNVLAFKTNENTADQADKLQKQADANTALNAKQNILFCDVAIILAESPPAMGPAPGQSAKSFKRQVKAAVGVIASAEQLDCKKVVTKARAERNPKVVNDALKAVGLKPDAPIIATGTGQKSSPLPAPEPPKRKPGITAPAPVNPSPVPTPSIPEPPATGATCLPELPADLPAVCLPDTGAIL